MCCHAFTCACEHTGWTLATNLPKQNQTQRRHLGSPLLPGRLTLAGTGLRPAGRGALHAGAAGPRRRQAGVPGWGPGPAARHRDEPGKSRERHGCPPARPRGLRVQGLCCCPSQGTRHMCEPSLWWCSLRMSGLGVQPGAAAEACVSLAFLALCQAALLACPWTRPNSCSVRWPRGTASRCSSGCRRRDTRYTCWTRRLVGARAGG